MQDIAMEEGIGGGRLPISHTRRIELRDAKMWRRETERHARTGARTSRCPCTLCLYGKPLLRTTQAKHVRDYGRHPMKRLQEEVSSPLRTPFLSLQIGTHYQGCCAGCLLGARLNSLVTMPSAILLYHLGTCGLHYELIAYGHGSH
jgi:hypothetical protein